MFGMERTHLSMLSDSDLRYAKAFLLLWLKLEQAKFELFSQKVIT